MEAGLRPDRFEVPYGSPDDRAGLLGWAAVPVIDRISQDLDGARMGLVLADQHGRVVDTRAPDANVQRLLDRIELAPGFLYAEENVGTNAIGTAIETSGSSIVQGPEHFADALTGVACSATPIRDPGTGRVLGAVDLTSAASDSSRLMTPLVKRAAWEIEQRLLDPFSAQDRVLNDRFLRARRSTHGAVAVVSPYRLLVNTPAARLLRDSDREFLWDLVRGARGEEAEIVLSDGRRIAIRAEAVIDAGRRIGALIHLGPRHEKGGPEPHVAASTRTLHGWQSLTETELAVAELVAAGLTN